MRRKYTELFYDNGNLKFEGVYQEGQANGYGKMYFQNGHLQYEGEWKNNLYHGKGKIYSEDGRLIYEGIFEFGKYHTSTESHLTEQYTSHLDNLMQELESLIGLHHVKKDVYNMINLVKVQQLRKKEGLRSTPISLHMVFSGNPGTGKTTIARLISEIYKELGVLSKGHLIEVDRSGLVSGYLGQTALKVKDVVGSAIGGILFIDEAYSLSNNNDDYGQEAIDTLIKMMEDHRNDLVVIVAGYPKQMEDFLNSNPGMQSRFNKHIQFDDYNEQELLEIIQYMCHKEAYEMDEELVNGLQTIFLSLVENKDSGTFGNARIVRNIFEKLIAYQANRIMSKPNLTKEDLTKLSNSDLQRIITNKDFKEISSVMPS